MSFSLKQFTARLRQAFARPAPDASTAPLFDDGAPPAQPRPPLRLPRLPRHTAPVVVVVLLLVAGGYTLVRHPPALTINPGQAALRTNQLTGHQQELGAGNVWVVPGLHRLRVLSLRDQNWKSAEMARHDGPAPVQSVEGLSLGVDVTVRFAVNPAQLALVASRLQVDPGAELVDPALQGVVYKTFARYTAREIFSTRRTEIQQAMEAELKPKLAAEGLILRNVQVGKIDLPPQYSERMETLLAEEMASEKMRYTLELKEKRVKESELEARADMVQRELQAEAAGKVQVIAAKAQEEAMKHVLPFKQRQVEQRKLEAEADKQSRIRTAEGNAEARRIEADGEALARQRLAQAEAFRLEAVGKANAEQMAREGSLLSRHPLLIQKVMADKLSDKVQVIIAAPGADGGFIGSGLLGHPGKAVALASGADANEGEEE